MMESRHQTILQLATILEKYKWLLNAYNMDYFIEDHWSSVPRTWKVCLEKINNTEDIIHILKPTNQNKILFPLSLLCLRKLSFIIRSRRQMSSDENLPMKSNISSNFGLTNEYTLPMKPLTTSDHILCRGIKLKKRHEIDRLCKIIPAIMNTTTDCRAVIDIGSGQGHLPRILTLCFGYQVYCVEANYDNISEAANHDNRAFTALKKRDFSNVLPDEMPTKVNRFLTDEHRIDQLLGKDDEVGNHLLMGLHACGPLSNFIIEEFSKNAKSRALVLACCCYMKASLNHFPMSSFLKKNLKFELSSEAKELACHAIEKFMNKFALNELESLKIHAFRACLELLIDQCCPSRRHNGMRSVKIDSSMTFTDYVAKATRGLGIDIPMETLSSLTVTECIRLIDRVVIFYSLRLLVAPIVELYILLDYQCFLSEQTDVNETYLVPLFDPLCSPRNYILIATK